MDIIILGAAGDVGCRAAGEALSRGHAVTGTIRRAAQLATLPNGVNPIVLDVADCEALANAMEGHDLSISAIRPPDGREDELVELTRSVLRAARTVGIRLLVVGGAASLKLLGADDMTLLDSGGIPEVAMPIARASFAQWELCAAETDADWTYLCPPGLLVPGERTGAFRRGIDTLLVDGDGNSAISMEDLAIALIDEAETPRHKRARFTVGY